MVFTSVALATGAAACGKAAVSTGAAAGTVGRDLADRAGEVPRGAEVCAMKKALAAPTPGVEKPLRETCADAATSEELWRRAMIVLGAYAARLEAVAGGADPTSAGQLAAARTGVAGPSWIEVEDPAEVETRAAVAKLVELLGQDEQKPDLDDMVRAATPHVETLCEGMDPYFDAQLSALAEIRRDVEKRQTSRSDRRCGMVDNRSFCVGESAQDRLDQGAVFGELAALMRGYVEAKNALARFCAAHAKLAEAAQAGRVKQRDTTAALIEAVKAARVTTLAAVDATASASSAPAGASSAGAAASTPKEK